MFIQTDRFAPAGERACDAEPIHLAGSIQPHGLLLVFDAATQLLVQSAGECERYVRRKPVPGLSASELLGQTLDELLTGHSLLPGGEPVHVGRLQRPDCPAANVSAHRTCSEVIVELEPESAAGTGAGMLERVRRITESIAWMPCLQRACEVAAAQVRAISGFDRVMIYRFNDDMSGTVLAEAAAASACSYLGHRFPASDIPSQARELYRRSLLRVIADVDYAPAPLEPPVAGKPLDMSNCILRSVSPVHLRYLKNMDVRASMSISIIVEGELWGLIACHHSSPRQVPVDARLLCRHAGATLAAFIHTNSIANTASAREAHRQTLEEVLAVIRSSKDPERTLRSSAPLLMSLIDCRGVALMADRVPVATCGRVPGEQGLAALAGIAQAALENRDSYSTDCLGRDYPEAAHLGADASGLIAIRIEASRPLLVLWLRPEQVEEICWAGNPHLKELSSEPSAALTPRSSFATWKETVRGRSRRWSSEEIRAAELFRSRADFILQRQRLERVNATLEQVNARLSVLATTDPLTGLANRRLFQEQLLSEWKRSLRHGSSIALIAVDVDNFKKYNDRFGHPAGDECLRLVAGALDEARRSGDLAARVGGEEFALLLPETDSHAAMAVAERLRQLVESRRIEHPLNPGAVVTISLGVAAGEAGAWEHCDAFSKAADDALYEAKAAGRNRVEARALAPAK